MHLTKVLFCLFIWDFNVQSAFTNDPNGLGLRRVTNKNTEFVDCENNDNVCREHKIIKKLKEKRIKEIKAEILRQLGLSAPINISNDELPSELTINMLKKHYGIQKLERKIDMESSIDKEKVTQTIKFSKLSQDGGNECFFEFKNLGETTKRALLWVYVKPNPYRFKSRIVQLILTKKHFENNQKAQNTSNIYTLKVSSRRGHWKNIDITTFLNKILSTFHPNQKLFVTATHRDVIVKDDVVFNPYIDMTSKGAKRRYKRSFQNLTDPECIGKDAYKFCCNLPNKIKFADVGWGFVIHPTEFDARYCKGDCAFEHVREAGRAKFILHAPGLSDDQRKSCCAPKDMRGFTILHYNKHHDITTSDMENMTIETCECL